ncbi:olfactory receptor 1019-like [Rhinatrema bivittatum]|uniref:olfactory receptor 1019-like n=1 Tax=Rhinatrema bivittatum TaxID=194408 RepID=UPI00112D35BF|nr:olfactory receptor 1019-like [Rhinatrema bivittatum]XP_029430582.1 olfactory receptor 1019-like [Rhinatrema bivittatum]
MKNQTAVTEFLLLGLSNLSYLKIPLFVLFLLIYCTTLVGNFLIISLIWTDSHLHTPMYFFLSNLSCLDCGCSTVIVPKMLSDFLVKRKTISFTGCFTQLYLFVVFACTEMLLLTVMAYDRYVAICYPLHYTSIMSKRICVRLAAGSWLSGLLYGLLHTFLTSRLSFCESNVINHFFCDIPPLLMLSCSEIVINLVAIFVSAVFLVIGAFSVAILSYIQIIRSILKIRSTKGQCKAFSTCSSHLTVVTIFYAAFAFTYMRPTSSYSLSKDRVVSVIYTALTPMLNPLIYSLRNKEVKTALIKIIQRKIYFINL